MYLRDYILVECRAAGRSHAQSKPVNRPHRVKWIGDIEMVSPRDRTYGAVVMGGFRGLIQPWIRRTRRSGGVQRLRATHPCL
jgi:hypothetical protein